MWCKVKCAPGTSDVTFIKVICYLGEPDPPRHMDDIFTKYILISNRFNYYKAVQSISAEGGCKRGVGRGEAARGGEEGRGVKCCMAG